MHRVISMFLVGSAFAAMTAANVGAAVEDVSPAAAVHAYVYPGNRVPLEPTVYGVNNEWRQITSAEFPAFNDKLHSLGYRMLRFPGGWESEHYDWATNTTPGWTHSPPRPGADAIQAKHAVDNVAFVLRTAPYLDNPTTANLNSLANRAHDLVLAHGDKVKHWIVGNEWWLQRGGGVERPQKLTRYATVFDANSSWPNVDGIDLHVYSGDDPAQATHYKNIAGNLAGIRSATGKRLLFVSEWAATKGHSLDNKRALRSVNNMVLVMHELIRAGATAMTYWPAPDMAPGIGLIEDANGSFTDLPHGQAFRWMATSMGRHSVLTTGTPETAAAHNTTDKTITVLIPSKTLTNQPITVHFANTDLSRVLSAEAMWMPDPDAPNQPARVARITPRLDSANNTVTVTANPGTAGRGSSYEMIRLIVRYQ